MKLSIITVKNMLIQHVFCLCSSTLLLVGANFVDIPTFDTNQVTIQNIENESLNFQCISSRSYNDGNNDFSWIGKTIRGNNFLTFIRVEDNIRGSIITAKKTYKVDGVLNNPTIRLNDVEAKSCGGCRFNNKIIKDPRSAAQRYHAWRKSDADQIDLMVIYPSLVKNEIGSSASTLAEIRAAVTDSNLCFRNSGVNVQLRLVHCEETSYVPTGNLDLDLERLTEKSDGFLDEVHFLRDQYGADIVTLLSTDSSSGGLANTLSFPTIQFEDKAFNVCVWDQITAPGYTLAHEVGHNMGCLHNREDADLTKTMSTYDYGKFAYGKRWVIGSDGYRTVMSYNDDASSYQHSIPYFSNPDTSYLGILTGNPGTEDNAKALNLSAPYVSNFRRSVIQGILPSIFEIDVPKGGHSSFSVRLSVMPSSEVALTVSISGASDFELSSPSIITFDEDNWNLPHPVSVYASDNGSLSALGATLQFAADEIESVNISLNEKQSENAGNYLSGIVVNRLGVGIEGVVFISENNETLMMTDENGTFGSILTSQFPGGISIQKKGYQFEPNIISVNDISKNSLSHSISATRSEVVYVDQQASGANNGTSWEDAFTSLSEALSVTEPITEVWVAKGTYYPGDIRSSSFVLPPEVEVLGGFSGSETLSSQRDYTLNQTILSGAVGSIEGEDFKSYHVLVALENSVLDGFIIEDGNASQNFTDERGVGGGLWAEGSAFVIRNCQFRNNSVYQGGGAIWLKTADATFINCEFSKNTTGGTGSGGAIWAIESNLTLQSCSFSENGSGFWGGAIRSDSTNLNIEDSVFSENSSFSSNGGGGIYQYGGVLEVNHSNFISNHATHEGGGILLTDANATISDSNFTENLNSVYNGGGALMIENSSCVVTGCNFTRNETQANSFGGAIKIVSSSPTISNCLFTENKNSVNSGGAIYIDENSAPNLSQNNFINNSASSWGGAIYAQNPSFSVTGGLFVGNWSYLGGAVATYGTTDISLYGVKALGNEANASTGGKGGFFYMGTGASTSKFVNCIFSGNKSNNRHGVAAIKGTSKFVNSTFYGNQASGGGGISLLFSGDSITLQNCILWNNSDPNGYEIWVNSGEANAEYTLLDSSKSPGISLGSNNLSSSPDFVDPEGSDLALGTQDDDLRLLSSSSAINVGSNSFVDYIDNDIVGITRDSTPDLGAYEYFQNSNPVYSGVTNFNIAEGNSVITDINGTDADGHSLSYSIIGGTDQSKILVDSHSGVLRFAEVPDYEYPHDSDIDNQYLITLNISDGYASTQVNIVVTVLDIDDSAASADSAIHLFNGYVLGEGWRQASWFGTYFSELYPWVYHIGLRWVYVVQSQNGNTWMWKNNQGWLWTTPSIFPFYYQNSSGIWAYLGSGDFFGKYYLFDGSTETGWKEIE